MKNILRLALVVSAFLILLATGAAGADADAYLPGGPLAGLKLPPAKHGPGPEVELYPGAVEHYRAYMMKYLPTRSFFDRQSLLKNWRAPDIAAGAGVRVERYAVPIYSLGRSTTRETTGRKRAAVAVIRCAAGNPVLSLDLGELEIGLYAVRVIGAVETGELRCFRKPLYITMRINDGPAGQDEVNTYRLRCGYVDDFYSVAEIYFHAVRKRRFRAELFVDRGSTVDLLVHNITLDDVLAGTQRRAIKKRMTLHTPEQIKQWKVSAGRLRYVKNVKPLSLDRRWRRDLAIWNWLPPINAQGSWLDFNVPLPGVQKGAADRVLANIEKQYGKWEPERVIDHNLGGVLYYRPQVYNAFLVNKKLNRHYTISDLIRRKPLPAPYPYKDDGSGLFFPDAKDPNKGRMLDIIAHAVGSRYRNGWSMAGGGARIWQVTENRESARDAAVNLVRYAYQFPAIDAANWFSCITVIPGAYNRDLRCRQREEIARWMPHYQNYLHSLGAYDLLFDYIKSDKDLARSIHRFVPWVHSPKDVISLLDVYLVQMTAKRIMRYHYHTLPTAIAECATLLADSAVTDPWMEWLFSRTFVYPLQPSGVQDLMISGCDREGPEYIGSAYYAQGEGASRVAAQLERYLAAGGNPKFDLSNAEVYPKPLAHSHWQLRMIVGGLDSARIGDVCGPDKQPGRAIGALAAAARRGWRWENDPRFAWLLRNIYGRQTETDAEWAKIEAAATEVKRAPWLDLRSRYVANWFVGLETGHQHDDYRFRRTAYMRVGMGIGHQHADSLDLQVVAHGLPMTIDGGQRSGYSKPNDRFTRIHNMVEVDSGWNLPDELGHRVHAWPTTLSDATGARYAAATAMVPRTKTYRRQIALIDVDAGSGSKSLSIGEQKPGAALPKGVTTPNSYVFDVVRVSGGKLHTYCFHGPVNDDFQWNLRNETKVGHVKATRKYDSDADYLSIFTSSPESKAAGPAPDVLQATWRCSRQGKWGTEQAMLGNNFNQASPRKYIRLHLLGASGMRALKADSLCLKLGYRFTCLMAKRKAEGANLESAFAAVIEPYAGQPFITALRLLPIRGNERDARRAVAVEVKTRSGHTDICFADGCPQKTREVGGVKFAGEFGCFSTDAAGLRLATLTGGTLLESADLRLRPAKREWTGKVVKADYRKKVMRIDQTWPASTRDQLFEIGTPGHCTAYTSASVTPDGDGSVFALPRGADFYRSQITRLDPAKKAIDCKVSIPLGVIKGYSKNWTASNDQMTKFLRVDHVGGNDFRARESFAEGDFAPENALRLWEYGRGDQVRRSTFVSWRRIEPGVYELDADVGVALGLKAERIEISADGEVWKALDTRPDGLWREVHLPAATFARGPVRVRPLR